MKNLVRWVAACLMCASLASAQEFRATISGYVFDSTGAAVPNAKVEAVNVATNETTNATSDTSGAYSIPTLRPGQYRVTASAQGFKQAIRENLTLEVGRTVGVNMTLEVGQLTESVTVNAEAAVLETQTASRVGVVTTTQVAELPLNSRNPFMLGSMMSGVNFRGAAIWQRPFDNGAIAEWSVNGGRQSNNEFLMDGAPNNAQMGSNNIAYVPPVDSVQEFSVQQNSYDAQYGKTGGGVFNVILKSGTNQHHGTVYEYMRRKWMDANTYQNNAIGQPRPNHSLDQYGFQLDGPILIPKLLTKESKVRLFYMGQYEGYKETWPQFLQNSFPEPEMRTGDFSRLRTANNEPIIIYDPATFDPATGSRQPFPGNVIPANRIHPVARAVTQYMPLPNRQQPGQRYATANRIDPDYAATDDFYNLTLKFDWNFGDNHRAFIRHASNDRTEDRCTNSICSGPGMSGQQPFQRINDAYVLDWVSTLSPTTILNIRASHNRFVEKGFGRDNQGFDLTSLGLPSSLTSQLPSPAYFGRWNFYNAATGTTNQYTELGRGQGINITNSYNLATNLTKIAGGHTLKMGVDLRRNHFIQQNSGDILQFNSRPNWTQRLWNQAEPNSGDAFASFLLGGVDGQVSYPLYPFFRQWYVAPYFQDDWKVSRRLTLNLGLRWDFNQYPDEKYNRVNRGFNPDVASPIAQQIPANMLAMYPQLRNLRGGLEFAGSNGNAETVGKMDWNNIQPRVGAAFAVNERMVIRAGYGLYYMNPNNDWNRTTGFSTQTPLVNTLDEGRTFVSNLLGNPYPGGVVTPSGASLGYNTFVGQNFTWFNPNMSLPRYHSFSFGIQRQLTNSSTLDVSYVGSRTVGANTERDFNLPSADLRRRCNLLEGGSPDYCNELLPNPFQGIAAFAGTPLGSAPTLSRWQLERPFPHFNGNLLEQGRGESKIWYNSLQVNYNLRFSSGLTLLANYTLSKMVERWGYTDPQNNVMQQGLYFSDRPHFFKFSTVYELPFGRGKKWGANAGGFLNRVIGGWQFSTFSQLASGEPNNLPGNVLMLKDPRTPGGRWTGTVDWNAHQVVGWNTCVLRQFNDGSVAPTQFSLDQGCGTNRENYAWLRVADYAPGQGNQPGRLTPNRSGQIRKQPFFNIDASLAKNTRITERLTAQFRFEAFNVTNYYFFGRDSHFETNPDNANFGTLFPHLAWIGNGYPRQMQLAFKLNW
ncbi:MAG TPA: carboxypeptidase regulatory-like domain-containing protein [Bryobacteraceae bacterium]|nr:carboxypeptidase regulatory-like domain-containing protein [Bryobacteraceae bacterium]